MTTTDFWPAMENKQEAVRSLQEHNEDISDATTLHPTSLLPGPARS